MFSEDVKADRVALIAGGILAAPVYGGGYLIASLGAGIWNTVAGAIDPDPVSAAGKLGNGAGLSGAAASGLLGVRKVLVDLAPIQLLPYRVGKGHHVPAKSAFLGDPVYNAMEALAIPNAELARLGVQHSAVTGAQASLYSAFARTGAVLTWEAMVTIEVEALTRAGMSQSMALPAVKAAIKALQNAGVTGPTRIPWGG